MVRLAKSKAKYDTDVAKLEDIHENKIKHSNKVVELVKEIIALLEEIPDGCAETFPFEIIETLKGEYL